MSIEQEVDQDIQSPPKKTTDMRCFSEQALAALIHRQRLEAQRAEVALIAERITVTRASINPMELATNVAMAVSKRMAELEAELKEAA